MLWGHHVFGPWPKVPSHNAEDLSDSIIPLNVECIDGSSHLESLSPLHFLQRSPSLKQKGTGKRCNMISLNEPLGTSVLFITQVMESRGVKLGGGRVQKRKGKQD